MARAWVTVILSVILLSGCGSLKVISDPDQVESINRGPDNVIEFWHTYSDEETRLLEESLIPAFEKEHPGILVKAVRQTNNEELKNTLIARASSKRGPDVVRMDIVWVPEFMEKGLLVPLSRFEDFDRIRMKLRQEVMNIGYHQNQYYSLPLNINTKTAIYNNKLLERAGLKSPPNTLEEVFHTAQTHHFTIGIGGLDSWRSLPYIYSLGGTLTNEIYTKATGYLDGPETVNAVETLLRLYREGVIDPSIMDGTGDLWGDVKSGNMLMTDDGPWFYSVFYGSALDDAIRSTTPMPMPHKKGRASIIGGENLVIMKGSKHSEEAWEFLKWMTGVEAQLIMAQTGLLPTNMDAFQQLNYSKNSYYRPFMEALGYAFVRPPVKGWSQIDETYTRYMRKIFQGDLGVQEGLSRAAREIDAILADRSH